MEEHKKTILFDGNSLEGWVNCDGEPANWELENGVMTVVPGDPESKNKNNILSREKHLDAVLHVEFRIPHMPDSTGQWRGNSGVFMQGRYEIQILDSYGVEIPKDNDCGAIYKMHAPLINTCKPPLEWQVFDVYFRSPRFDENGEVVEHARITLLHNNVIIHNNVEMKKPTGKKIQPGVEPDVSKPGPILLQCHGPGDRVSFRNIWLQHLPAEPPAQR